MQSKPNAAILYAAKSTADPHGSIPTQIEDGRAFAEREELEVIAIYSDEAASAWSGDRGPELAAALKHAGEVGAALIVQHSDRLARGDGKQARHLAELYFTANRAGVTLRSVQDDSTFDSPILAAVMGERNMEDSRRKGLAVKAGLDRRRKRGQHIGFPSLGYRLERDLTQPDERRGLVPEWAGAAIIRRIFGEFLAGETQLGIARNLDHDGVKTPRGGKWHQSSVRYVLRNPLYVGLVRDGEELIDGEHEAIIDRETWDKTQALLVAQAKTHRTGRTAGLHLFRKGFLSCGQCEASMVPRTSNDAYLCYGHLRDPESCSQPSIPRAEVDGAVWRYFQSVKFDLDATRAEVAEKIDRRLTESRSLSAEADAEVATLAANMERVRCDYKAGRICAEDWSDLRAEFEDELDGAQRKAKQLAGQLEAVEAQDELADVEVAVLERLAKIRAAIAGQVNDAMSVDAVRAELMQLFDGFILHRDGTPPAKVANVELVSEGGWIEPLVKTQDGLLPVLTADQAENNYASLVSIH